jgi:hypothetical protein
MVISPIVKRIFAEEESRDILQFLKEKTIVYHRPYKRYNKIVKVPRGQASFTFNEKYITITAGLREDPRRMKLCVTD